MSRSSHSRSEAKTVGGDFHFGQVQKCAKQKPRSVCIVRRQHRRTLVVSPPASASPKRHGAELGHHNHVARSRAVDPRAHRALLGFVPEQDIVLPTLTVIESLRFAARLKLPPDLPAAAREAEVELTLRRLGL